MKSERGETKAFASSTTCCEKGELGSFHSEAYVSADESNCTAVKTLSGCNITLTPSGVEVKIMPIVYT